MIRRVVLGTLCAAALLSFAQTADAQFKAARGYSRQTYNRQAVYRPTYNPHAYQQRRYAVRPTSHVQQASHGNYWSAVGHQPNAFGRVWGGAYSNRNWDRFYHYPYVYYPQNFWGNEYFRSSDSLYYRYPPEMRIPVYNRHWFNYYPSARRYHFGHHFILDIF